MYINYIKVCTPVRLLLLFTAAVIFVTVPSLEAVNNQVLESEYGVYVVTLKDPPVVGMFSEEDSEERGLKFRIDRKINKNDPKVKEYVQKLKMMQDEFLSEENISLSKRGSQYFYTSNGFTVKLNKEELKKMSLNKKVLKITPVERYEPHSITPPN